MKVLLLICALVGLARSQYYLERPSTTSKGNVRIVYKASTCSGIGRAEVWYSSSWRALADCSGQFTRTIDAESFCEQLGYSSGASSVYYEASTSVTGFVNPSISNRVFFTSMTCSSAGFGLFCTGCKGTFYTSGSSSTCGSTWASTSTSTTSPGLNSGSTYYRRDRYVDCLGSASNTCQGPFTSAQLYDSSRSSSSSSCTLSGTNSSGGSVAGAVAGLIVGVIFAICCCLCIVVAIVVVVCGGGVMCGVAICGGKKNHTTVATSVATASTNQNANTVNVMVAPQQQYPVAGQPAGSMPVQGYPPTAQPGYAPQQGYPPQGYAPTQQYAPAQGAAPGYAPQQYAPAQGAAPGYAPQGAPQQYAPAQGAAPGYAPQGAAPGYAPQGAAPAYAPQY